MKVKAVTINGDCTEGTAEQTLFLPPMITAMGQRCCCAAWRGVEDKEELLGNAGHVRRGVVGDTLCRR
ncbi:MAG: hypothetical protein AAF449_14415 [Myxococcota bacterium]